MSRIKGLKDLVQDGVHHGTTAVEQVHRAVASRPFDVLEAVPVIGGPTRGVRVAHDTMLTLVYGAIRGVNRIVGGFADGVLEGMDQGKGNDGE